MTSQDLGASPMVDPDESPAAPAKRASWVRRWNDTISAKPELPGVWRRKDGGFRIRGRAVDPRTGQMREHNRVLADCKRPREAAAILEGELDKIRQGTASAGPTRIPPFHSFAATVFERKVANGSIASASRRATWDWALRVHLIPAFGDLFVDKLTRDAVERWKVEVLLAERTHAKDERRKRELAGGRYRPHTANTVLEILRQITAEASDEFNIADPCRRLENVSKRGHRTYTYEEPNSVAPADVPAFLAEFRVRYPDHNFRVPRFHDGPPPELAPPAARARPERRYQVG